MSELSDRELRERLIADTGAGWRAFVDQYTPLLLKIIQNSGVRDRDDIMELYTLTCEHLAADDCARLRRHDPGKGALSSWLGTVVRRVLVDWVRSVRGRKRLFGSIRELGTVDQDVFELFYWRRQPVAEIAERVRDPHRPIGLSAVFESLERIERALTPRQRTELLAMAARSADPVALEDKRGELQVDVAADRPDPDAAIETSRRAEALARAMSELPAEDRLIVSMRFYDGLTLTEIQRALHLERLTADRVSSILARLRAILDRQGRDLALPRLAGNGGAA